MHDITCAASRNKALDTMGIVVQRYKRKQPMRCTGNFYGNWDIFSAVSLNTQLEMTYIVEWSEVITSSRY